MPILGNGNDYDKLLHEVVAKVDKHLKKGEKFMLRDIIDNPPSGLGVRFFKDVSNGKIPNVKSLGQNSEKIYHYEKT